MSPDIFKSHKERTGRTHIHWNQLAIVEERSEELNAAVVCTDEGGVIAPLWTQNQTQLTTVT